MVIMLLVESDQSGAQRLKVVGIFLSEVFDHLQQNLLEFNLSYFSSLLRYHWKGKQTWKISAKLFAPPDASAFKQ